MEDLARAGLGEHLDADTLAAFAECALSEHERVAIYGHLAECEMCRAYLAAHGSLRDFEWRRDEGDGRRWTGSWSAGRFLRAAAAMAALWLLFSAVPRRPVGTVSRASLSAGRVRHVSARTPPVFDAWGSDPRQKLSAGDRLAERNARRFREEVTLATVSFGGARARLAVNEIELKTALGDRRIRVEGFGNRGVRELRSLTPN
jgi:hypothetical protein